MFKLIIFYLLWISLIIAVGIGEARAQNTVPATIEKWDLTRTGTMKITYITVSKHGVFEFVHQYKVVSYAEPVPACNEVAIVGEKVHLITQESYPKKYIIERVPLSGYRGIGTIHEGN